MGLDNYPDKLPCKSGKIKVVRTEDGKIDCLRTECPFKEIGHVTGGVTGTFCWLRGGVYDDIVRWATSEENTLYEPLERKEVEEILKLLRSKKAEFTEKNPSPQLREDHEALIKYFETLLSFENWKTLIAWW